MKSLKELLSEEEPVVGQEITITIESVRIMPIREQYGDLAALGADIEREGLCHPITVWTGGTLISGARRLRAHFLLSAASGNRKYRHIRAVFVDTIEDAAKRLLADAATEDHAVAYKPSELCRLWDILRQLDEPAAAQRADQARRRGVELRRKTRAGERPPGRSASRGKGEEYTLRVIAEPFGMSEVTASRLMTIYNLAGGPGVPQDRREQAAAALAAIDRGESSIWANYSRLISKRSAPVSSPKSPAAVGSAPAARQRAAWDRSLPQMEGLVAGLVELGPPNTDLTWDQIGPTCTRLMAIRRDLEKLIKKMKESDKS